MRGAASKTGGAVALVIPGPGTVVVRLAWAPQPKLLVVRVDEVGRAEAVAYAAMGRGVV